MPAKYTSGGSGRSFSISPLRAISSDVISTTMSSNGLTVNGNYHAATIVPRTTTSPHRKRRADELLLKLDLRTPHAEGFVGPLDYGPDSNV